MRKISLPKTLPFFSAIVQYRSGREYTREDGSAGVRVLAPSFFLKMTDPLRKLESTCAFLVFSSFFCASTTCGLQFVPTAAANTTLYHQQAVSWPGGDVESRASTTTNVLPAGRMFLFSRSLRMGLRNVRKDSSRSLVILRLDKMELPCSTTQK